MHRNRRDADGAVSILQIRLEACAYSAKDKGARLQGSENTVRGITLIAADKGTSAITDSDPRPGTI